MGLSPRAVETVVQGQKMLEGVHSLHILSLFVKALDGQHSGNSRHTRDDGLSLLQEQESASAVRWVRQSYAILTPF